MKWQQGYRLLWIPKERNILFSNLEVMSCFCWVTCHQRSPLMPSRFQWWWTPWRMATSFHCISTVRSKITSIWQYQKMELEMKGLNLLQTVFVWILVPNTWNLWVMIFLYFENICSSFVGSLMSTFRRRNWPQRNWPHRRRSEEKSTDG